MSVPYNKWINTIAKTTFGVLLIHAHVSGMRELIWNTVFKCVDHFGTPTMPIHAVSSIFIVAFFCIVIDLMRIRFVESWFMHHIIIPYSKRFSSYFREQNN